MVNLIILSQSTSTAMLRISTKIAHKIFCYFLLNIDGFFSGTKQENRKNVKPSGVVSDAVTRRLWAGNLNVPIALD